MRKKLISSLLAATMVMATVVSVGAATEEAKDDTAATEEADTTDESGEVVGITIPEVLEGSYTIGYAPATLNNAFWIAVKDGLQKAVDESGVDVKIVDVDAGGDQAIMNDGIANLISSGIDALICAPADSTAVVSAFEQCKEAGIPVINFDTPVEGDAVDLVETIIASDNYNAGYVVGQDAAEKMEDGAKILVLHSPRASACVDRLDGFIAALHESGKEYEIVNTLDGKGEQETSLGLASDALVADPDLSIIFAVNDPSAMGAANAVQQTSVQLEKDIMIYGVDGNPDAKKMIKSGAMEGTGSQSPETLGYDSMAAAFNVLSGNEVDKDISVDTFLITADNVDQYGTDGWQ